MSLEPGEQLVERGEQLLAKLETLRRHLNVFVAQLQLDQVGKHEFAWQISAAREHVRYARFVFLSFVKQRTLNVFYFELTRLVLVIRKYIKIKYSSLEI